MHLIRRSKKDSLIERVKESLNKVKGAFAYLILTPNELIEHWIRMALGRFHSDKCPMVLIFYQVRLVHSMLWVLSLSVRLSLEKWLSSIMNAIILKNIRRLRTISVNTMEYIYFARPDSNIAGVNVHTARKNMGRMLAKEAPAEADVVVGVPNSSLSASGYAEQSGIPYEMGLVKNQYIARTFIQPTQALRKLGVRMKLSAVSGVVKGKKVVVIDDSIVRGTTI